MEKRIFHLQNLSALHVGTGQGVGVVDLPIARAKASNLPIVAGSAIKGVLRDELYQQDFIKNHDVKILFGASTDSDDDSMHAGAIAFGDANLLLFPIRSFAGTVAYATCPYILRQYKRDMELDLKIPSNGETAGVVENSSLFVGNTSKIALEDLDIDANHNDTIEAWAKKMPNQKFLVQYKLDGASLELQYKNGKFVKAVTRGNGKIGDDITQNVKKMKGFQDELLASSSPTGANPFSGGIRGEVIMTHKTHAEHFSNKANCRNAANGLMKKKNGEKCEYLEVICYDAVQGSVGQAFVGEAPFSNEEEKLAWLKASGFITVDIKTCNSAKEVIAYREEVMALRPQLEFDIDGLVVKMNEIDPSDMKRARPEKQIAFKFSLEEAKTTLKGIEWSESGVTYTPIALIEPVRLAGTIVKRASLANPNIIESLNLKIGSEVLVTKRGEIIPKIEALIENPDDAKLIEYPKTCSACKTSLKNEGTRLFCPNINCPKLIHHRIEKWISVLDIRDFGITLIKRLFEMGRVNSIPDLYTIDIEELASIDRMGSISAKKVYNALHAKKEIPLTKFIAGFDLDGIGETMVEKLELAGFDTIEKFFSAKAIDFEKVYHFGDVLSKSLVESLARMRPEMEELLNSGNIKIKETSLDSEDLPLKGISFCFTGELNTMKRKEAGEMVKSLGGIVKSSVVKGLSYLVTNSPNSGSSKNKKAKELGTQIINEEEFLKLVKVET